MKVEVEMTEEQLSLMINSLEIVFRIMMRQPSLAADYLSIMPDKEKCGDEWKNEFERYLVRKENAQAVLDALIKVLYGPYQQGIPVESHRISDMWSAWRHMQYQLHPHEDGYDVRKAEPFRMSDFPMMKIKILEAE